MLKRLDTVRFHETEARSPPLRFANSLCAGMGNIRAAFRMRAQVLTFLFSPIAAGQHQKKCRRRAIADSILSMTAG